MAGIDPLTEDMSRAVAINFFIHPRPSRNGLVVVKVQEKKLKMEGWTIYNVVAIFSHCKLDKIKTYKKKKAFQAAQLNATPQGFFQIKNCCKTYKYSLTSGFIDPLDKEKDLDVFHYKEN